MAAIRNYTDKQLLDKAKSLPTFKGIPTGYWIQGVRSLGDAPDQYDDKAYLWKGETFITVMPITTNPGAFGLLNFMSYNPTGCAVALADTWNYDCWHGGFHKGKMKALVQIGPIAYTRDNNKNMKSENYGKVYYNLIGLNFHTCSYEGVIAKLKNFVGKLIGKWSEGCQVAAIPEKYYQFIEEPYKQQTVSYCLLNEFEV
jgi:hypothetical protein